jgi:hypothetical protein
VPTPGDGFIVLGGEPGPDIFRKYDKSGRLLGSFGRIVSGKVQHPLVLDGSVVTSGNIFLCYPLCRYPCLVLTVGQS